MSNHAAPIVCKGQEFIAYDRAWPLPNDDINGIGVIFSFTIAAYVSLVLSVLFHAMGCVPKQLLNDFDVQFLRFPAQPKLSYTLVSDFEKGALFISEQQLAITIGILAAGFIGMMDTLAFDFHTIIYLAWMASIMHLSSLSMIRSYFHDRPWLRLFRVSTLLVSFIMMCIAIFPTIHFQWAATILAKEGSCPHPESCPGLTLSVGYHWSRVKKGENITLPGILSYLILFLSHIWQGLMLYPSIYQNHATFTCAPQKWIQSAMSWSVKGPRASSPGWLTACRCLMAVYMLLLTVLELLGSHAFGLYITTASLMWSSVNLLVPHFKVIPPCARETLDNWSFGQVLPLLLLLVPLYSTLTFYLGRDPCIQLRPEATTTLDMPTAHQIIQGPESPRTGAQPNQKLSSLLAQVGRHAPGAQKQLHQYLVTTHVFRRNSGVLSFFCIFFLGIFYCNVLLRGLETWRSMYWVLTVILTLYTLGTVGLMGMYCLYHCLSGELVLHHMDNASDEAL